MPSALRVSIWLPLALLLVTLPALGQLHDEILAGVNDFHCHTGPDALPRSLSDLELARLAKSAGMRGLVLKNHYTMTADRAALVMREVEGIEVPGDHTGGGRVHPAHDQRRIHKTPRFR